MPMLPQLEAMLAHLGAMLGISWGPLLGHLGAHCPPFMLTRAHPPKTAIMPVRVARITDTTLGKHMVFAFRDHLPTTKILIYHPQAR